MPNPKINWLNEHFQLMEDYLNSKSDDFDGFAAKRFLLGQARG